MSNVSVVSRAIRLVRLPVTTSASLVTALVKGVMVVRLVIWLVKVVVIVVLDVSVANLVTLSAMELVTPATEIVTTVVMAHKAVVYVRQDVICFMPHPKKQPVVTQAKPQGFTTAIPDK